MNGIDIVKYFETKFPKTLAYDWDNVGLQVGSLNRKCKTVLVTLDVTKEVLAEAIALKAELIFSHHPLIFKPMSNILTESPRGHLIEGLLQNHIAVYSAHTNYDLAEGGMNDELANVLKIQNPQVLDEVAGIGRLGTIEPTPVLEVVEFVKKTFRVPFARYIGKTDAIIQILGISGGSGSEHVGAAQKKHCDLYITGDVTYHTALDCRQMGQNVLDIGHSVEAIFKTAVVSFLSSAFPEVRFIASAIDTDPYQTL